jgi:hypothetical protein
MRSVHFLPAACALALFWTPAHAQTKTDWTVKPERSIPLAQLPYDHTFGDIFVPPVALNAKTTGPINVWIRPYNDRSIQLYEPKGSHEDDYMVQIDLPKALPQPFAVQLVGVGLRRLYDSKRVRNEPSYGHKLPGAHETKAMIRFSWQY